MHVRVVKDHLLKAPGFFDKCKGMLFPVIWKREGGYDCDLAPLGHHGQWGFMYDGEVEEVDQSPDLVGILAEHGHDAVKYFIKTEIMPGKNPDGSLILSPYQVNELLRLVNTPLKELEDYEQEAFREGAVGKLHRIVKMFKPRKNEVAAKT